MDRILSIEDRVLILVEEFCNHLEVEPFESALQDYRFRLRSKLVELLTQAKDPQMINAGLDNALEGIQRYFEERINRADLSKEKELSRLIKVLTVTHQILSELMYDEKIKDKGTLSKVVGTLGQMLENLRLEYQRRFGGILRKLKRLFF